MKPDIDLIPTHGLGHVNLPAMCFRKPSSTFVIQSQQKETVSDKQIAFRECKDSRICKGTHIHPISHHSCETDVYSLKIWYVGNFSLPLRVTYKDTVLIALCSLPAEGTECKNLIYLEVFPLTVFVGCCRHMREFNTPPSCTLSMRHIGPTELQRTGCGTSVSVSCDMCIYKMHQCFSTDYFSI